ncbi:MAG: 23S rRNA (adenine(2030)-N(6))-methyltransferase RlmJ [Phycisphaerales bacterium]|nr:23S rRNA (adenine(2030)-N(6))-methyltransferase RlmJ [Phycisphaerales bacterium]
MANHHFGNIGDIWKHLPLCEILAIVQPARYWETHAGSACYDLSHTPGRDHGIYRFLRAAPGEEPLAASRYRALLSEMPKRAAEPAVYPGSPHLAMRCLQERGAMFIFCDIDGSSLDDIQRAADDLHVPRDCVRCVAADGIASIFEQLEKLNDEEAARTFIHIDPFLLHAAGEQGMNSVELFCEATKRGAQVMLWYAFDSPTPRRTDVWDLFRSTSAAHDLSRSTHNLWAGEISMPGVTASQLPDISLAGCGILCANLTDPALAACDALGRSFARIYHDIRFADGAVGQYDFTTACDL